MSASHKGSPDAPGHDDGPGLLGGGGTDRYGEPVGLELGDPAFGDIGERSQAFEALFDVPDEPQRLGRYAVLGTLGRGAMGTVFEAFDPAQDRRVALKVLHASVPDATRLRLVEEARAQAVLTHPCIVPVLDVGEADGQTFIATELVRGRTLTKWREQKPRPSWRETIGVYVQAGEGLAAAHAEGFVHADFKPGNAVVDDEGRVRLFDFGLMRSDDTPSEAEPPDPADADPVLRLSLVGTGAVLGTPAYMPLEQMRGQPADARTDQFGFCVSLYEALYGERPFDDRSMDTLIESMTHDRVRPAPEGSAVPPEVRDALRRGLLADPEQRWPAMAPLLAELRRLAAPARRWPWLVAVGGLVAAGVGVWRLGGESPPPPVPDARPAAVCDAASPLEGVWDPARRAEVERAILGTERSFAPDTWERLEQGLGEHAEAWTSAYAEVCRAGDASAGSTASTGPRLDCLGQSLGALRATVAALAAVDPTTVEDAVALMDANLVAPSRCLEDEAGSEPAGSSTRHRDEAASQSRRGVALRRQGQLDDARAHHERALALRRERSGPRSVAVARSLTNLGAVLTAQGQLDAALEHHQQALDIQQEVLGPLHPHVAASLSNLGAVLGRQGRLDEARAQYRRALTIYEQAYGSPHPAVAASLVALAQLALAQRDFETARAHAERAVQIRETSSAAGSPELLADARFVLAQVLLTRPRQRARALELAEQARDAYAQRGTDGSDRLATIEAWIDEAEALLTQGRGAETPAGPESPAGAESSAGTEAPGAEAAAGTETPAGPEAPAGSEAPE